MSFTLTDLRRTSRLEFRRTRSSLTRLRPENWLVARNEERSVVTGDTGYQVRRSGFYHDDDPIQRQRGGASMASNLETTKEAYELGRLAV
jgi:hypothetical protein